MFKNFKFKCGLLPAVLAVFMTLLPSVAMAQSTITVTGTVTDSDNEPLMGATVMVKNSSNGVATNLDGYYSITAAPGDVLIVSYIGYNPKEEAINGRSTVNFVLSANTEMLDEVVVVGYGVQRRGSITGAVSAIKGDEMLKTNNENPQNMLTGKIPGVRV